MIIVPKKNIYLPERKWGIPKFQKGVLHPVGFWKDVGAGGGIVKLSTAWALNSYTAASAVTTSITFNTDGSISTSTNDTSTLPDADNWWTAQPETAIGDNYEVAVTAIGAGSFSTGLALNTWGRLDVARGWTVRVLAKAAPDVKSVTGVTWAIRTYPGGATQDSVTGCAMSASN